MILDMIRNAGLRPSAQRIAVLAFVANTRRHPSADQIFNELSASFPSLSRTTIYNSLHTLVDAKLLRELEIESNTMRYDLAPQPQHGHFICRHCGKIYDTVLPEHLQETLDKDFLIDSIDIVFRGVCPDCKDINTQKK